MHNPYFQVARTYLKRPFCSLQRSLIIAGILFLFALFLFQSSARVKYDFLPIYYILFVILFFYWAIHVKEQFADARASLTPGFRNVHAAVAAIAAIVLVILLPGVTALLIGWQFFGLISITTFLFGTILWTILSGHLTFAALFWIGSNFLFLYSPIKNSIEQIVLGMEPIQAIIIIIIGIILSITGIIRLFLLNEEKPEYHLNVKFPIDGQAKLSNLQWKKAEKQYSKGWQRWIANRMVFKMIYHSRHAADSYWSRMHRWDYSGLSVWFSLFFAIFVNLLLMLIGFFNSRLDSPPPAVWIFMPTFIPIIMSIRMAIVKNSLLSHDLIMPVRRGAYLKQVGMLVAYCQFTMWGVMMAVSIVWMFTQAVKPTPEILIYSVSYSLMIQIWLFGLAVLVLSLRSITLTFLIMNIAAIFSAFPINFMTFEAQTMFQWRHLIMPLGCLLEAIGLLLTWWGYRRWLVADFN
jgi:hypothetical protein